MPSCLRLLIFAACGLLAGPVAMASGPVSYDFHALTAGAMSVSTTPGTAGNQDGWYLDNATAVSVLYVTAGTGMNTTNVTAIGPSTSRGDAIRNFGAAFFTGTETAAVLQFDFRVGQKYSGGTVALGGNQTAAALDSDFQTRFSPGLLVGTADNESGLTLRITPKQANGTWLTLTPQTILWSAITSSGKTAAIGDWMQVKMVMDFTANAGAGSGSLFYRDLTIGQTAFTASTIANVNLGLTYNTAGYGAANWNQVYLRENNYTATMTKPVAIDNLYIESRPLAAGPGSEDFEGSLVSRLFNVYDYTSGTPVTKSLVFPDFVPLLDNHSAQGFQFNDSYIPNTSHTADFARIEADPVNPANKCLFLHVFPTPGASSGRNELHYSTPYLPDTQPNGTLYTFAFRFYTPVVLAGHQILMQGYSDFPWIRIRAIEGQLMLDLAKSSGTAAQNLGADLDGNNYGDSENPWLGSYKVGRWNTVVVQVIHSNDPATGRIEVFVNGNKMTTYSGRTTFYTDSSRIPFMKAGPYGNEASIWYDDISWQPGLVYPFAEAGLENNGIYELEPRCALGKRAGANATGSGDPNNVQLGTGAGSSRQRWTAQLQADGSFELMSNFDAAKRLDVNGGGGSGTNVQILTDGNQTKQRWKSQWLADGGFELIPQHNTALRLDVAGGSSADGTNVQVLTANSSSTAQHWNLRPCLPPPSAPTGLSGATPTLTTIPLSWNLAISAAGYLLERRSEVGSFEQIANLPFGDTLSYSDTPESSATAYQYRIFAYNSSGTSVASAVAGGAVPDGGSQLLRPGFLTVAAGSGSGLNLAWYDNSYNETGFELGRRVANGDWTVLQTLPANTTSFTDASPLAGVIYEYRLRATSAAGSSAWAVTTSLLHTSAATLAGAISSPGGIAFTQGDIPAGSGYGPVGLLYHLPPASFVSGQSLSSLRNDIGGWVGTKLTVGAASLTIHELGRWVVAGNTAAHAVKLVAAATSVDVPGGAVSVATAGAPSGQFKYVPLATAVTLAANTAYYLISQEANGGDQWSNWGTVLTYPASVATINNSVYCNGAPPYNNMGYANDSFGPLDFRYSVATPFTLGHSLINLRNDYSGWLGMKITVGETQLAVSQLGRWVVPGNSASHTLKLVDAATGADLAAATLATSGAATGQFQYAALVSPVTLAPHTSYFVLSQESAGGDAWYDFAQAAAGSATGYQSWLLANGLPMDASGNGSATATPANDSLPNLVKYALGLVAATSGHGGRLGSGTTTVSGSDFLTFTYVRPEPSPAGVSYAVEAAVDLAGATWSAVGLIETSSAVASGLRTITTRDNTPMGASNKRFMRLRITQP